MTEQEVAWTGEGRRAGEEADNSKQRWKATWILSLPFSVLTTNPETFVTTECKRASLSNSKQAALQHWTPAGRPLTQLKSEITVGSTPNLLSPSHVRCQPQAPGYLTCAFWQLATHLGAHKTHQTQEKWTYIGLLSMMQRRHVFDKACRRGTKHLCSPCWDTWSPWKLALCSYWNFTV